MARAYDPAHDLQLVRDVAAGRTTPEAQPWVFDDDVLYFAVARLETAPGCVERLVAALRERERLDPEGRARVLACLGPSTRARVDAGPAT